MPNRYVLQSKSKTIRTIFVDRDASDDSNGVFFVVEKTQTKAGNERGCNKGMHTSISAANQQLAAICEHLIRKGWKVLQSPFSGRMPAVEWRAQDGGPVIPIVF